MTVNEIKSYTLGFLNGMDTQLKSPTKTEESLELVNHALQSIINFIDLEDLTNNKG